MHLTSAESISFGATATDQSAENNANLSELHEQLTAQAEDSGPSFENGTAATETSGQLDPDMTKATSDIIDHSERFEHYCAMSAADDVAATASKGLIFAKTASRMKIESLPILDNLVSTYFVIRSRLE